MAHARVARGPQVLEVREHHVGRARSRAVAGLARVRDGHRIVLQQLQQHAVALPHPPALLQEGGELDPR
eukprot:3481647-Pyramimonas_sp.AAC.1